MRDAPSFAAFFAAIHPGREPFPWQNRLVEEVLANGWPELLDIPTGAGKTTALDVALYCLAQAPDRMPRRTVLVVDRRIVVDQGAAHARAVLHRLQEATSGPALWAAQVLRSLWNGEKEDPPFAVAVMRGGMPRDNDWARRPDQPVLGVSTVDQVGSRLLFRGYGVSSRSASIQAGLIGNDTLILLDEVHLAVPFAQTLDAIRRRYMRTTIGLPARFSVVQMSATPGDAVSHAQVFKLGDADWNHQDLGKRLKSKKLAKLMQVKVAGDDEAKKRQALAEAAVAEALRLQGQGARVVAIVVNRVDTARQAFTLLNSQGNRSEALLVTGRMRPVDRDFIVRTALLPRSGVGRDRSADKPLVVVATQCIEAGADLDFDGLVTECASLDALRQRFGRVDRRGELGQSASVILARTDQIADGAEDAVYGAALSETWKWLGNRAAEGTVDLGSTALAGCSVPEHVLAPLQVGPVLLPGHLDAWAQTSPIPTTDPDVSLWLHGARREMADVQIVWRNNVPTNTEDVPALIERLSACRPSTLEAVTVPLGAARRWLTNAPPSAIADVVAGDAEDGESQPRKRSDDHDDQSVALRWDGEDSKPVSGREIRPGDVLIVDSRIGGLSSGTFDPANTEPVMDLGDIAQLRSRGLATLRLQRDAMRAWDLPAEMVSTLPTAADPDETPTELLSRVAAWLGGFPSAPAHGFSGTEGEWRAAQHAFGSRRMRVQQLGDEMIVVAQVARRDMLDDAEAGDALTEDDESSFRQVEVSLRVHSTDVQSLAAKFGRAVGFGDAIVEDLALAAWFHDVGKADPRFQRWLVGGSEVRAALLDEPIAKSALPPGNAERRRLARQRSGYPVGYRHELLSLAMVEAHADALAQAHDRDLVLHLVASHHGWCRPFAPAFDHADDLSVKLQHGDVALAAGTRHRRSRLDSGVSDRFWALIDRYGWWGLAWLEAVLRLADHRASEQEAEGRP